MLLIDLTVLTQDFLWSDKWNLVLFNLATGQYCRQSANIPVHLRVLMRLNQFTWQVGALKLKVWLGVADNFLAFEVLVVSKGDAFRAVNTTAHGGANVGLAS